MIKTNHKSTKMLDKHLLGLYGQELWYLAVSIKDKCEEIFEKAPVPEKDGYITVDPEVHTLISSVLSHSANIKKLLKTPTQKQRNESTAAYNLRQHRAKELAEVFKDISLSEIMNAKVRNTLEHFDEYLDQSIVQLSDSKKRKSPWAAYNMVLSKKDIFNPHAFPVRVYISEERKFYNMKWSIDIGLIYQQSEAMIEVLQKTGEFPEGAEHGGLLIQFEREKT